MLKLVVPGESHTIHSLLRYLLCTAPVNFASGNTRPMRTKAQVHSILDDIPGIGPKRRKALMKHFPTIDELKAASAEKIAEVEEIPQNVANDIYEFFHPAE